MCKADRFIPDPASDTVDAAAISQQPASFANHGPEKREVGVMDTMAVIWFWQTRLAIPDEKSAARRALGIPVISTMPALFLKKKNNLQK